MTRETKIGLLVGLAFIIVIGILLSDHLTSSTEPPQAALGGSANGVRQAVDSPGVSGAPAPVTVITPVVTPQQTVATQGELATPTPAVQIVKIGGPVEPPVQPTREPSPADSQSEQGGQAKQDEPPAAPAPTAAAQNVVPPSNDTPVITPVSNPPMATDTELTKVAQAHGEQLVSADDNKPAAGSAQAYVAQPGDSLSRIAARFLGSGSKANRDLIIKANPSLQANENMIIAGKTYQIPAAGKTIAKAKTVAAAANDTASTVDETAAKPASATEEKPSRAASDAGYVYTVQPGDNLTKIARDQVGDVHAVAAIQELNPDKLKGANHDIVIAGSKIRLPGKPLARAD
jgi:LysM repeat protein